MIIKGLLSKPILVIGIIFVAIVIMDWRNRGKLFSRPKIIPTSCRAVIVMLERRIPGTWKVECEGENLAVLIDEVKYSNDAELSILDIRGKLYRTMANNFIHIARNSPQETLERLAIVRLRIAHSRLVINAVAYGKDVVRLSNLHSPQLISEHLKATVQVKETLK